MALSFAQEDAEEELLAKALYVDNNDDGFWVLEFMFSN